MILQVYLIFSKSSNEEINFTYLWPRAVYTDSQRRFIRISPERNLFKNSYTSAA